MAAYKDEKRGTWYVSFHYYDWTGKNCRKVKRGFKTKREATEWEHHFRMKEASESGYDFWRVCRSLHQRYEAETKTQYLADKGAYSADEVIAIF